MKDSLLTLLIGLAIVDSFVFVCIAFAFALKMSKKPKESDVSRVSTLETPGEVLHRVAAPKARAKKDVPATTLPLRPSQPKPADEVLDKLIDSARKNVDKCSICSAYVVFYEKGKFKSEGMTTAGVMSHLDTHNK